MAELSGQIVRVSQDETARNYKFYEEAKKLNKNIQVVSVDDLDDYRNAGYIIPADAVDGSILTKHPFHPKEYIDINVAEEIIIREKINHIGEIVQLLGARKVEGHVLSGESKTQELDSNNKIHYKVVDAEFNFKTLKDKKSSQNYVLKRTFSGVRSSENYAEAIRIMERYGMDKDIEIKTLVEMCNPARNNLMTSQKVQTDISREVNSSKECAFTLGYLNIFSLDMKVKHSISELKTLNFECLIEF